MESKNHARTDDLHQKLRNEIAARFRVDPSSLDADAKLFSDGLLDSLNVMELVLLVEKLIGTPVLPTDITLENFDSIGQIIDFSMKRRGAA